MEKITEILDKLDLAKFVPELDKLMELVLKVAKFSVRVGPVCILLLGIIYLFLHPNEANYKAGYRTFFGMGSVHAWRFTQRVSGFIMLISGLIMNSAAKKAAKRFTVKDPNAMFDEVLALVKTQIIWVLVIFVFMILLTAVLFNRKGKCRFKALENTGFYKLLTCNASKTVKKMIRAQKKGKRVKPESSPVPEETQAQEAPVEDAVTYERQGEQSITADDIIIEYQ